MGWEKTQLLQELVAEYRARSLDINAKTIKKVSEAKARKKKRLLRKMDRARKRAQSLIDNPELTEQEKTSEMRRFLLIRLLIAQGKM